MTKNKPLKGQLIRHCANARLLNCCKTTEGNIIYAGELFPTGVPVYSALRSEAFDEISAKKAAGKVFSTANDFIAASNELCA